MSVFHDMASYKLSNYYYYYKKNYFYKNIIIIIIILVPLVVKIPKVKSYKKI